MAIPYATAAVEFDADLLARYDVVGPRYTSYPTAPNFREDFGEAQYRIAARESNEDPIPRPLSLYVHVPFCESPCFYCGCTRLITREHGHARALPRPPRTRDRAAGRAVRRRSPGRPAAPRWRHAELPRHRRAGAPHRGAGGRFQPQLEDDRDYSIELDPRYLAPGFIEALSEIGFNRVSLGVQDLDPEVQRAINRIQPAEPDGDAIAAGARRACARSTSTSSTACRSSTRSRLPGRWSPSSRLKPERIALYAYAHLPERFKAQRQIRAGDLPAPAEKLALLGTAIGELTRAGYRYIGMDHFALANDSLARAQDAGTLQRNFQGYSTHGQCDMVGLGMSAISHVDGCYAQNLRDLPAYYRTPRAA